MEINPEARAILLRLVTDALGSQVDAGQWLDAWLMTPNEHLNDQTPYNLIGRRYGLQSVVNALEQSI